MVQLHPTMVPVLIHNSQLDQRKVGCHNVILFVNYCKNTCVHFTAILLGSAVTVNRHDCPESFFLLICITSSYLSINVVTMHHTPLMLWSVD